MPIESMNVVALRSTTTSPGCPARTSSKAERRRGAVRKSSSPVTFTSGAEPAPESAGTSTSTENGGSVTDDHLTQSATGADGTLDRA